MLLKPWNWVKSPYEDEEMVCIVGPFYVTHLADDESSKGYIFLEKVKVFFVEKLVQAEVMDELENFILDHYEKFSNSIVPEKQTGGE